MFLYIGSGRGRRTRDDGYYRVTGANICFYLHVHCTILGEYTS